jgi:hypothetical protein
MKNYNRKCAYACAFTYFSVLSGIAAIVIAMYHAPTMAVTFLASASALFAALTKYTSLKISLMLKMSDNKDSNTDFMPKDCKHD